MQVPMKALLLGWSVLVFVSFGHWFHLYERLIPPHARHLRDTLRQCATGMAAVILFQYLLRLDLSRPFIDSSPPMRTSCCACSVSSRRAGGRHPPRVRTAALRHGGGTRRSARCIWPSAGGFRPVRRPADRLPCDRVDPPSTITLKQTYPVHLLAELPDIVRRRVIDEILWPSIRACCPISKRRSCSATRRRAHARGRGLLPHVNSTVYLDRFATRRC